MPNGSWYFDGYRRVEIIKPNGKPGFRLEYRGEWYGIDGDAAHNRQLKRTIVCLNVVSYVMYFHAQFYPSVGGMIHWLAIPSLLALVPMIWQVMGLVNYLPSGPRWEIRVYYAGYRRLYRSTFAVLALVSVWAAMEVIYTLLFAPAPLGEVRYLLEALSTAAALGAQVGVMKKNPAVVIEGPEIR